MGNSWEEIPSQGYNHTISLGYFDERCTSLHWDPSGRPYEGWIQCLLMALLGSLQDAPCVDTTQVSGGCILTYTILRLIWDPGMTMIGSLVIARGCF